MGILQLVEDRLDVSRRSQDGLNQSLQGKHPFDARNAQGNRPQLQNSSPSAFAAIRRDLVCTIKRPAADQRPRYQEISQWGRSLIIKYKLVEGQHKANNAAGTTYGKSSGFDGTLVKIMPAAGHGIHRPVV